VATATRHHLKAASLGMKMAAQMVGKAEPIPAETQSVRGLEPAAAA